MSIRRGCEDEEGEISEETEGEIVNVEGFSSPPKLDAKELETEH
jgi:hypothetical protein